MEDNEQEEVGYKPMSAAAIEQHEAKVNEEIRAYLKQHEGDAYSGT